MQFNLQLKVIIIGLICWLQVIHSGIPVTIIPLDATDTIPLTKNFFEVFEQNQDTVEAQYIFQSLKIARDYRLGDQFYTVISEMHSSLQCSKWNFRFFFSYVYTYQEKIKILLVTIA